ncbi:phosphatidylethanolamine-binding protein [Melampsora americana]|nr:phosphatidylethanolamine-binding protein [Melampsora americana]
MLRSIMRPTHHHTLFSIASYLLISQSPLTQAQATPAQIIEVVSKYDALNLSSESPVGFGIPLKSLALLNVNYPNGTVNLGQAYDQSDVANKPTISITPVVATVENFKDPNVFTLIMSDANALGNPDPKTGFRHYLKNGVTFGDLTQNNTLNIDDGSGTLVTDYVAPAPPLNSGPHRYAWLLFIQPLGFFNAPSNLSSVNTGAGHWDLKSYVNSSGLGDLVAASFFTVQNGTASFSSNATNSSSAWNVTSTNATSSANTNAHASFAPGQYVHLIDLMKIVFASGVVGISSLIV